MVRADTVVRGKGARHKQSAPQTIDCNCFVATSLSVSIWVVREYDAFDAKLFGFLLGKY